jgi:hypothetical protein
MQVNGMLPFNADHIHYFSVPYCWDGQPEDMACAAAGVAENDD